MHGGGWADDASMSGKNKGLQHASSPPSPPPPLPTIALLFFRSLVGVKVRYGSNYKEVLGAKANICFRPFQAYPLCNWSIYYEVQNKLWISLKLTKAVGRVVWKQWVNKIWLWMHHSISVPAVLTIRLCDLLVYSLHWNQNAVSALFQYSAFLFFIDV